MLLVKAYLFYTDFHVGGAILPAIGLAIVLAGQRIQAYGEVGLSIQLVKSTDLNHRSRLAIDDQTLPRFFNILR